jgi:hypothetical protein
MKSADFHRAISMIFVLASMFSRTLLGAPAVLLSAPISEQVYLPAIQTPIAVYQNFVYAVTDDHKHILRRTLDEPGPWILCPTTAHFTNITGLSADGGELYVVDAGSQTVYSLAIESGIPTTLYQGSPILEPEDLAYAANHLYIADLQKGVLDLNLSSHQLVVFNIGNALPTSGHIHLAVGGGQLLISNPDESILISISNPSLAGAKTRTDYLCPPTSPSCLRPNNDSGADKLIAAVLPSLPKIAAVQHPGPIAIKDGVIYSIDTVLNQLFASSRTTLRPIRLYSYDHKVTSPTRVLATDDSIVLYDSSLRDITIWPLLVPTEVVVDVQKAEPLSAIYNYLYDKGLLPTKTVSLDRSIEKTLRDQGVLLSPYSRLMNPVICGLNHTICVKGNLLRTLPVGLQLVIPDLYSESYIDVRTVKLDGSRSLEEEVDHRIQSDGFDPWKSPDKLIQLNPQFHSSEPISQQREGIFTIPVELVRYVVAFPKQDLSNRSSNLSALRRKYDDALDVYSLQTAKTTSQDDTHLNELLVALDQLSFQKAFKTLQATIHYVHPTPQFVANPVIGIAEEFIDCDNPDIKDNCTKLTGASSTSPQSIPLTTVETPPTFRLFKSADHGTAVAGIIAAREAGISGRGLDAPEGYVLFLYSEGDLGEEVKRAVLYNGAQVFNFSFKFDSPVPPEKLADIVSEKSPNKLVNALFVVAAPDDGKPVCVADQNWPICWADQSNVIGVAATTLDGTELLQNAGGSKWGSQYVQVAAPGIGFGATGVNKDYVSIAGTSFAAPIISATAALLIEQGVDSPQLIKQRIIATAAVRPTYKDNIQGGLVDVSRAVSHVREGVLVRGPISDHPDPASDLVVQIPPGSQLVLTTATRPDIQIDMRSLLRLTLQNTGKYRAVFQDNLNPGRLIVWDDVTFPIDKPWKFNYRLPNEPGQGLNPILRGDLSQFVDYYGPIK